MQVGWNDGLMEVLPVYVTSYISLILWIADAVKHGCH